MASARAGIATLLLVTGLTTAPAIGQTLVLRGVVGNASTSLAGPSLLLRGTAGQTAIGWADGPQLSLQQGFWPDPALQLAGIGPLVPAAVFLGRNVPNPFNPMTTITFSVPAPAGVRLTVHDLRGRVVATLVDHEVPEGRHEAIWRGKDDAGRQVAAGAYFAVLQTGGKRLTRKMCVVK